MFCGLPQLSVKGFLSPFRQCSTQNSSKADGPLTACHPCTCCKQSQATATLACVGLLKHLKKRFANLSCTALTYMDYLVNLTLSGVQDLSEVLEPTKTALQPRQHFVCGSTGYPELTCSVHAELVCDQVHGHALNIMERCKKKREPSIGTPVMSDSDHKGGRLFSKLQHRSPQTDAVCAAYGNLDLDTTLV